MGDAFESAGWKIKWTAVAVSGNAQGRTWHACWAQMFAGCVRGHVCGNVRMIYGGVRGFAVRRGAGIVDAVSRRRV